MAPSTQPLQPRAMSLPAKERRPTGRWTARSGPVSSAAPARSRAFASARAGPASRRLSIARAVVVPGRRVDPERADVRVAENVALQGLAVDLVLVDAARERLMARFSLTERQAQAILDIQLRR